MGAVIVKRESSGVWYACGVSGGGQLYSWTRDRTRAQRINAAVADAVVRYYQSRPSGGPLTFEDPDQPAPCQCGDPPTGLTTEVVPPAGVS